jgi:hypothetical protein
MKKLMSIFGVILFAFALTLTSCDSGSEEASNPETEVAACGDECAKACCLGCKATEGDAKCMVSEDGTMPCCAAKAVDGDADAEAHGDHGHDHEKEAACCCGDATCDGSCHAAAEEAAE